MLSIEDRGRRWGRVLEIDISRSRGGRRRGQFSLEALELELEERSAAQSRAFLFFRGFELRFVVSRSCKFASYSRIASQPHDHAIVVAPGDNLP